LQSAEQIVHGPILMPEQQDEESKTQSNEDTKASDENK